MESDLSVFLLGCLPFSIKVTINLAKKPRENSSSPFSTKTVSVKFYLEVRINSKIIIMDVIASIDYYTKVQSLFVREGFGVYFEKDSGQLKNLLSSFKDSPVLIVFGESFDFKEYLEFNALKQLDGTLKNVPIICF